MFWAESFQCNSALFNRRACGSAGSASKLPCSASNVLEPILHPGIVPLEISSCIVVLCVLFVGYMTTLGGDLTSGKVILMQSFTPARIFGEGLEYFLYCPFDYLYEIPEYLGMALSIFHISPLVIWIKFLRSTQRTSVYRFPVVVWCCVSYLLAIRQG